MILSTHIESKQCHSALPCHPHGHKIGQTEEVTGVECRIQEVNACARI